MAVTHSDYNEIKLDVKGRYSELPAGAVNIEPGMLLSVVAGPPAVAGLADVPLMVVPHGAAGQRPDPSIRIASAPYLRNQTTGGLPGNTVEDIHNLGDLLPYYAPLPEDSTLAILVPGTNYTPGMPLTSNGDGRMKEATGADEIICINREALDLTAPGSVALLNPVRF